MTADSQYVVVDANVIVYLLTGSPEAERFAPYLEGKIGLVSFQTVAELRFIARRRSWGQKRVQELEDLLKRMVVIGATDQITSRWAELMYEQTRSGSEILPPDGWVAATAFVYQCPVVTNDRKDFERIPGLTLFPPSGSESGD